MQPYTRIEISVGAFVVIGLAALAYLSLTLGGLELARERKYRLTARFSSVGELKPGDPVKMAGVNVGEVARIALVDFSAEAELLVQEGVKVPEDTIASIQSAGLLGDAHVSLSPGGAENDLAPDGRIRRTEPAVSLTELIAKYAFGSPVSDDDEDGDEGKASGAAAADDLLEALDAPLKPDAPDEGAAPDAAPARPALPAQPDGPLE
jgi:phospholipid/cholesterol/gamma-HCH transport system substrate-binding protein